MVNTLPFAQYRGSDNLTVIVQRGLMMNKWLVPLFFALLSSNLMADSFRCGNGVIKSGDSSNRLVKKCGDPVRKYSAKETIYDNGRRYDAGVVNWVYERRGKKDMIVSVRSGIVIKIQPN